MSQMTFNMVLTGPRAGKTCVLNGHQFIDGVCALQGDPESLKYAFTYLGRAYQAYPEGSEELKLAQQRDKENARGDSNEPSKGPKSGKAKEVPSDPPAAGSGPSGEGADEQRGDDGAEGGSEGSVPGGDGHEDPRVSEEPPAVEPKDRALTAKIVSALNKLDPSDDSHWTKAGLPALSVLQQVEGLNSITRADVNAADPNWNRDTAAHNL